MEKKQFGFAFLFWLIGGAIGAHRIYTTERAHFILWYWLANACTLGILALVDVFLLKRILDKEKQKYELTTQFKVR
jgi:membrane protein implicated in regulation of membrane protease activity